MRISDWSSDVCSSDLPRRRYHPETWKQVRAERQGVLSKRRGILNVVQCKILQGLMLREIAPRQWRDCPILGQYRRHIFAFPEGNPAVNAGAQKRKNMIQIGRPSCRKRVGQYV